MSRKANYTGQDKKMEQFINRFLNANRGKTFTYVQLVSEYLQQEHRIQLTEKDFMDICDKGKYKGELQSARQAKKTIKNYFTSSGHDECFIEVGPKKGGSFGYAENLDFNPLDLNSTEYHQMRRNALVELLRHSNGIISNDILCKSGFGGKDREIIHFETSENLKNVRLIADLYFAILEHQVITFHYTSYKNFSEDIILSPHYLKEYNHRWYVIGYVDKSVDNIGIYAIERIDSDVTVQKELKWIKPDENFDYANYFSDIVGVTHQKDKKSHEPYPPVEILLETLNQETHGLITSLKIFKKQETLRDYDPKTNTPGLIRLYIRTNQQLLEELFKYSIDYNGPGIRIVKPISLADTIKARAQKIVNLYNKNIRTNKKKKQ